MTRDFVPEKLDIPAFAEAATPLSAHEALRAYPRLAAEAASGAEAVTVQWQAVGERRPEAEGGVAAWLHLQAEVTLPLVCQRCLGPIEVKLDVDRWFRFAADEATAAQQDAEADEDVLASSPEFDLHALIEDELLMELPVAPRHETCPGAVQLSVQDPGFEAAAEARPNPFAVLGDWQARKPQ